jgi:hypothetical protein
MNPPSIHTYGKYRRRVYKSNTKLISRNVDTVISRNVDTVISRNVESKRIKRGRSHNRRKNRPAKAATKSWRVKMDGDVYDQ